MAVTEVTVTWRFPVGVVREVGGSVGCVVTADAAGGVEVVGSDVEGGIGTEVGAIVGGLSFAGCPPLAA